MSKKTKQTKLSKSELDLVEKHKRAASNLGLLPEAIEEGLISLEAIEKIDHPFLKGDE